MISRKAKRLMSHLALIVLCIGAQEPYKPAAHLRLLEQLPQHPREYAGYLDLPGPLPLIKPGTQLRIRDEAFAVGDMLGEGGFAKVRITLGLRKPVLQIRILRIPVFSGLPVRGMDPDPSIIKQK